MRVVLSVDLSSESRAARAWCAENLAPGTSVVVVPTGAVGPSTGVATVQAGA
jgi:hypothetical protein